MNKLIIKSFAKNALMATMSLLMLMACQNNTSKTETQMNNSNEKSNELSLTQEWDKVFPLSEKVVHQKVTYKNHFGITIAADVYVPKNADFAKLPAVAVAGPFGAVKEQVSGLYAMRMAERGYVAVASDPSYMGESGGEPRGVNSPDLNTEDFQAAIDYLTTREDVDTARLGIIGICGWGGFALNTAAIDTRIKATLIVTMYNMTQVYANDYFDQNDNEAARYAKRKALSERRTADARNGNYARTEGFPKTAPADAPQFLKDYIDFYETPRGYHKRSIGSNGGWLSQTFTSLQNTQILAYVNEIRGAVLMIHGEKAHSRYFAENAFEKMTGVKPEPGKSIAVGNKELMIIPDIRHTDLYDDKAGAIPYNKIEKFFGENLK